MSFYSPLLMEILATTVDGVGISVEASTNSIRSLLGVLTSGMAFTKERGILMAAIRTAKILGISIENWEIGERKKKPVSDTRIDNGSQKITNENRKMEKVPKSKLKPWTRLGKACWRCDICGHESREAKTIQRHVQIHSNNHKYECLKCSYTFKNTESLNSHISIAHLDSHKVKDEPEEHCTRRRSALDNSMIKKENSWTEDHSKIDDPSCFESGSDNDPAVVINIKESGTQDEEMFYINETGEHVCLKCDTVIKHHKGMIRHLKTHSGVRFYCDICGADFSRRDNLQNHIRDKHADGRDQSEDGRTAKSNYEKSSTDKEN